MKTESKEKLAIIIVSLLINALVLIAMLSIFHPIFETNDDNGLLALVNGSRGLRDSHMVYSNILMGSLLVKLFSLNETIQWTAAIQYITLYISFSTVTYALITRLKGFFSCLIVTAAIMWFSYEAYICMQYTKTAGIVAASGLLAIFFVLSEERISKVMMVLGFALALVGSFYRVQQAFCTVGIFGALVLHHFLQIGITPESKKRCVSSIIAGLMIILTMVGFRWYDRVQYSAEDWSYYLQYDKYRVDVIDYGVPSYGRHEKEYNSLGIDETAYELLKKQIIQDPEKFNPGVFKQIAEFREKEKISISMIKSFAKDWKNGLKNESSFWCFVVVWLGWLLLGRHSLKDWLALLLLTMIVTAFYFYLYYAGRFMIHRVDVAIWYSATIIILYMYGRGGSDVIKSLVVAAIVASFFNVVQWRNYLKPIDDSAIQTSRDNREVINFIHDDEEHLYLTKLGVLDFNSAFGVFEPIPFGIANNIYPLGGWAAETPTYKVALKRYNVSNPFRDMVNNKKILLVDNRIDKTVAYIRKWYYPTAEEELINEVNGRKIYRIVAE